MSIIQNEINDRRKPERQIGLTVLGPNRDSEILTVIHGIEGDREEGSNHFLWLFAGSIQGDVKLYIESDGFEPYEAIITLPENTTELPAITLTSIPVIISPPPPPIIKPTRPPTYPWKGDFLGNFDYPALMYGGMPDELRAKIRAEHKARNYTHIPLNVHQDYNRFPQWHYHLWDNPNRYIELVEEIENNGLYCVIVLHHYDSQADSVEDHIRRVGNFWPKVAARLGSNRLFMWGYEINGDPGDWKNGTRQLDYLKALKDILGPNARIAIHFTPERWAGWPGFDGKDQDKNEFDWLRLAAQYNVEILLYQAHWEGENSSKAEIIDRCFKIPSPFGYRPGIAGRVVDGAGIKFVLYEYSRNESRGIDIGTEAMKYELCSGFGNGGPIL